MAENIFCNIANIFQAFAYSNTTLFATCNLSFTPATGVYLRFHHSKIISRLRFNLAVSLPAAITDSTAIPS